MFLIMPFCESSNPFLALSRVLLNITEYGLNMVLLNSTDLYNGLQKTEEELQVSFSIPSYDIGHLPKGSQKAPIGSRRVMRCQHGEDHDQVPQYAVGKLLI